MAKADKDNRLKQISLRFCLISGMVPYLNVNLRSASELGEQREFLTDIDVLGVSVDDKGFIRRTLFDCKTAKTSVINRAFWVAGLSSFIGADEAFVLLERKAVETHRLAARAINAFLFDEQTFNAYAEAISIDYVDPKFYMADIDAWFAASEAVGRYPKLEPIASFLKGDIVLPNFVNASFRYLIGTTRALKGEFDPDKPTHMYLFCEIVGGALLLLATMANEFRGFFDPLAPKADFGRTLRYYVWGGRDSYEMRKRMVESTRAAAVEAPKATGKADVAPFEFYHWDAFIELFRALLDAPREIPTAVLPAREIAFRQILPAKPDLDKNLSALLKKNRRIRQFIFITADYIIGATGLPKDFKTAIEGMVNALMMEPAL